MECIEHGYVTRECRLDIKVFRNAASTQSLICGRMVKMRGSYRGKAILKSGVGIIWRIDYSVTGTFPGQLEFIFQAVFMLLGFILLSLVIYSFPLTARYVNPISATLKNALILTVAKLPYTFVMVVVTAGSVLASLWNTTTLMFAIPMWLVFGGALVAWINSWILRRVFSYLKEQKAEKRLNNNTKEEVEG